MSRSLTSAVWVALVATPTGTVRARQVVVATGPFQTPHIPALADRLNSGVPQRHSAEYRDPTEPVTVAVGTRSTELPQRIAGRDLFFWLTRAGVFTAPSNSRIARRLRDRGDLVIGNRSRTLRLRGVDFRPRLTDVDGRTATFADGTTVDVDTVVRANGYRSGHAWLHVPGVVVDGAVRTGVRVVSLANDLHSVDRVGLDLLTTLGT